MIKVRVKIFGLYLVCAYRALGMLQTSGVNCPIRLGLSYS